MEFISLADAVDRTGKSESELLSERISSRGAYVHIRRPPGDALTLVMVMPVECIPFIYGSIEAGTIRLPANTIEQLSESDKPVFISEMMGRDILDGFFVKIYGEGFQADDVDQWYRILVYKGSVVNHGHFFNKSEKVRDTLSFVREDIFLDEGGLIASEDHQILFDKVIKRKIKPSTLERYKKMQLRVNEYSLKYKYLTHKDICARIATEFGCAAGTIRKNTQLTKRQF